MTARLIGGPLLAIAVALAARESPPTSTQRRPLRAPKTAEPITLNGELDERIWTHGAVRTGAFVAANGAAARPYSEARFAWADGMLYVGLYAADEDIRARATKPDDPLWIDDTFHLVFVTAPGGEERVIDVSPRGVVTDARRAGGSLDFAWQSGTRAGHEMDGTIDDSRDDDEEWVLELAIPLSSLGLDGRRGDTIELAIQRCDTPRGAARACGSWGDRGTGWIVLD